MRINSKTYNQYETRPNNLDTVDINLIPPPPGALLADKKGGGELVWYRDLQDFSPKKGGGELVWYEIVDFFFVKIVSSGGIFKILVKYDFLG